MANLLTEAAGRRLPLAIRIDAKTISTDSQLSLARMSAGAANCTVVAWTFAVRASET
jgi:hypothetical protein